MLAGLSNVNVNSGKSVKLEFDVVFGKPKAEIKWSDFYCILLRKFTFFFHFKRREKLVISHYYPVQLCTK